MIQTPYANTHGICYTEEKNINFLILPFHFGTQMLKVVFCIIFSAKIKLVAGIYYRCFLHAPNLLNFSYRFGRTPLHVAAATDYPEMIDFLFKKGGMYQPSSLLISYWLSITFSIERIE